MPKRRSAMELRDVVRRLKAAQGIRRIHEETGVHRTIIRALRDTAEAQGWLKPEAALPNEEEIQQARSKEVSPEARSHPLEVFRPQIEQWVQAGHSYVVMHQLIKERCLCSEATLRRFVQKRFPSRPRVSVARPTVAGQDREVDFGYLGVTYDPIGRRNRKTWLFSGRLRHSRLAWREAIVEQRGGVFFLCHIHAFEYFGGVPLNAIPDYVLRNIIGVLGYPFNRRNPDLRFSTGGPLRRARDSGRDHGFSVVPVALRAAAWLR